MSETGSARQRSKAPQLYDYALLALLAAIWGSSFLVIKIGVETLPALPFTALRLVLGTAVMLGYAVLIGENPFQRDQPWGLILASGFFGNTLPFILIGWGEEGIDSGLAAILMALGPLTTVVVAHVMTTDDKLTWAKAAGVALGVVGLIVLIGPDKLATLGDETVRQLAVAFAACCYGLNAVITRYIQRASRTPPATMGALVVFSAMLFSLPTLYFVPVATTEVTVPAFLAALVMAVIHTAFATLLFFALVRTQGPSFTSQVNFLVPLFGVFWGVSVLSEEPQWQALAALVIILAGMAIARGSGK